MTEYEIADLALSTQEGIRQQASLVQAQGSVALSSIAGFTSVLFGYLIVAYFVGASLTRAQSIALTLLYLFFMILNRAQFVVIMLGGQNLLKGLMEINPNAMPQPLWSDAGIVVTEVIVAAMIAASLYFMWSMRHPNPE
jgi:hypothetical protein